MLYKLELHEEQVSTLFYALMTSLEGRVSYHSLDVDDFWKAYKLENELLKQLAMQLDNMYSYNRCVKCIEDGILDKKSLKRS